MRSELFKHPDGAFSKNSQQRYLKTLNILVKRLILDAWLNLRCAFNKFKKWTTSKDGIIF